MAETTSPAEFPRGGYTFEDVWAAIMKDKEELEDWRKENRERQKKIDRQISRLGKQMGGLHNRFGKLAEHLVVPGIVKRFTEIGYHFNRGMDGNIRIYDEQGNVRTEVDVLLENDEYIVVVEVKSKPVMKDVGHHIRRMEILREYYEKRHDDRKLYGAIAGAVFGHDEKEATIEEGMFVLEQSGDTIKMTIPAGFVPKEW